MKIGLLWPLLVGGLVILIGLKSSTLSVAAPPGFAPGQAAANEVTEFRGTLKAVRGNLMTVTREDGTDCLVAFPDNPGSLVYVAKALPAYLRRGMAVRFATNFGPAGTPIAPVEKIEIFAPINTRGMPGHSKESFEPGIHAADHQPRARNQPITGKATVVGNLMMLTPQGGLAVQAGRYPVQTMVAPTATLELRINNLSLAKPGDPVSVAGFYQPPDDTKVKADRITITSDIVYGEAPPPQAKPTRKSRKAKADEAEQAEAKDAEQAEAKEGDEAAKAGQGDEGDGVKAEGGLADEAS